MIFKLGNLWSFHSFARPLRHSSRVSSRSVNVVLKETFLGYSLFYCPAPLVETLTPMVFVTRGTQAAGNALEGWGPRVICFANESAIV